MENPATDNFAYERWAETEAAGVAAQTILLDDRVFMLRPAEQPLLGTLLTVTCSPVTAVLDSVEMKFDARIVMDVHSHGSVFLGPHEL